MKTFASPKIITASLAFFFCLIFGASARAATVVEVPGKALSNLLGQPVAGIRLYASTAGAGPQPIPFQIDEKTESGAWLMDQEGKGTGILDPQDVLLFHTDDAGAALDPSSLPAAKARAEIPVGGKFVYALSEEQPAARSAKSYVRYLPGQDRVSTAFYDIGFNPRQPLVQDILVLHNGSSQADLLDRFKVRFNLAIKHFFDFQIDESGVDARVAGTRVGPIRVIRRVVATKKLGPINLVPKSVTDFLFYPNWVEVPTRINNPLDGPKFLEDKTEGLSGYDFSKAVYGATVYTAAGGTAVLDGSGGAEESALSQGASSWWALSGPMGSLTVGISNDPKLAALGIAPKLRIIDDAKRSDPPEGEAGEALVGFDLPYHKIPKGSYLILVKQVFPWRFVHGQEPAYLQEAKTLRVESAKAL
ncbi:MAG: hypothetical protein U1F66_00765 [bacterium]